MAQYRLTKKAIVLIIVLFLLIGGGAGGYLFWRVNQPETVAPTEADAGGGVGSCCFPSVGCSAGWKCDTTKVCTTCENPYVGAPGVACGPKNANGQQPGCRSTFACKDGKCCPTPEGPSLGTCVADTSPDPTEGTCATWITQNRTKCEWPKVLMSGRTTSSQDLCRCETCSGRVASDPYSCTGNPPTNCTVPSCPSGYTSCGTSVSHESGSDCKISTSKYCMVKHPDCGNNSYIFRYCKPTVSNVCETGGITTPSNAAGYEVGDVINITGWAADADGINPNKVVVTINGSVVGNATVKTACAPDNADAALCTSQGEAKKPVVWEFDYTVTETGTADIHVKWEDTKGATGSTCEATRSITADITGNPDWRIVKDGVNVCVVNTPGSMQARADYTVTITNVGDLAGQLSELKDTLDTKVQNSYIQSSTISPTTTTSGNIITWNLDGDLGRFEPNVSKIFRYSILIPESAFGQYSNTAVATPDSGSAFSSSEIVFITCGEIPETGLFDSTVSKVALGLVLLGAGIMYASSKGRIFDSISLKVSDIAGYAVSPAKRDMAVRKSRKKRFERKIAGE